ncbi:MAG: rod-binding protein [Lachnospiraceae bacterium]|nr:rod-binding protein [Lachnospiraceae bacterium]
MMDLSSISNYYNSVATKVPASANNISQLSDADMKEKTDDELMEVCKEFESYLLEQVFKEMDKTTSIFGEDEDSTSSQMVDYFKETTIAELASQSTEQNSLGLAQMLYEQMKRNYNI